MKKRIVKHSATFVILAAFAVVGLGSLPVSADGGPESNGPNAPKIAEFAQPGTKLADLEASTHMTFEYRWVEPKFLGAGVSLRKDLWSEFSVNGAASLAAVLKYPASLKEGTGDKWADLVNGVKLGFSIPVTETGFGPTLTGYRHDENSTVATDWPGFDAGKKTRNENENVSLQNFEDVLLSPFYTLTPYYLDSEIRIFHLTTVKGRMNFHAQEGKPVQHLAELRDMMVAFKWNPKTKEVRTFVTERTGYNDYRTTQLYPGQSNLTFNVTSDGARMVSTGRSEVVCNTVEVKVTSQDSARYRRDGKYWVDGKWIYVGDLESGECEAPVTLFHHLLVPDTARMSSTTKDWEHSGSVLRVMTDMIDHANLRELAVVVEMTQRRAERFQELRGKRMDLPEEFSLDDFRPTSRAKFLAFVTRNPKLARHEKESEKAWLERISQELPPSLRGVLSFQDAKTLKIEQNDDNGTGQASDPGLIGPDNLIALAMELGYENPFTKRRIEEFKQLLDSQMY